MLSVSVIRTILVECRRILGCHVQRISVWSSMEDRKTDRRHLPLWLAVVKSQKQQVYHPDCGDDSNRWTKITHYVRSGAPYSYVTDWFYK